MRTAFFAFAVFCFFVILGAINPRGKTGRRGQKFVCLRGELGAYIRNISRAFWPPLAAAFPHLTATRLGRGGEAAAVLRLREVTILSAEPHSRTAHQLCPQELQVPAHSAPRTCRVPTKPFKANHQRHYKACQGEVHRQEPPREHKVLLDPMQVALRRRFLELWFLELRALELRALELRGPTVHQMARLRTPITERMRFRAEPRTA